jgi:hypothetical protein
VINLEDELEDSPGKQKFLQHMKEESSYLPMAVLPENVEKKRIIKKVRFHDDEPVVVQDAAPQLKVGAKRAMTRNTDGPIEEQEEDEASINVHEMEAECEKDFQAIQEKQNKRQKVEEAEEKPVV